MGSPFTSRHVGRGSGRIGCFDFFEDLDLTFGASTGFAVHARVFAVLGGALATDEAATCANSWTEVEVGIVRKSWTAMAGNQNARRLLILMSLPEGLDFASVHGLAVRNQPPIEFRAMCAIRLGFVSFQHAYQGARDVSWI